MNPCDCLIWVVLLLFALATCMYMLTQKQYEEEYFNNRDNVPNITRAPEQNASMPCSKNSIIENGICKSCPIDRIYDPLTETCKLKNVPLSKPVEKVCPRDTISIGNTCRYPCPNGLKPSQDGNVCEHPNKDAIPVSISPLHCPFSAPYLRVSDMTCHNQMKETPLVMELEHIPITPYPVDADTSLII